MIVHILEAILPSAAVCCKSDSDTDTASETSGPEPDDLPLLLEHIVDAVGFKEGGNLKEAVQEVIKRSHVTREQILNLSHATVTQRNSSMWSSQRKGRITASNMYRLMSDRNNPNYDATVRAIMQYDTSDISFVPSVKWGIDNEENAIKGYCKHMSGIHVNFKYDRTGLVLCDKYSFLAASPDGLVSCNCHDSKVVEIKCPYSVRNDTEILEKIDYLSNGSLKRNHKYFSQVQTQMFVCNTKYCDFVVWTPDEMLIVDVDIDLVYCEDLFKKVQHFATNYLVPELLSNSLKCGNPRASANDNKVYCLCKRPKFGKMIACDGDNCECEWFHYGCVGLLRKPRRKWYCNECLSKE